MNKVHKLKYLLLQLVILNIILCISTESLKEYHNLRQPFIYYEKKFIQWMKNFSKSFHNANDYLHRLHIFALNDDFINKHNKKNNLKYKLGHNEFSAMTWDEFNNQYKGGVDINKQYLEERKQKENNNETLTAINYDISKLPKSIDWVEKGAVTPVKNQGQCGACWAFSTTGAIEGAVFISDHKLISLSEQELVDCDHNGDMGCNGGLMDHAFQWVEEHGGVCSESEYKYHARAGECRRCQTKAKVTGYTDVKGYDEESMMVAVAKQPVSVAIEADQPQFQFYKEGVFDSPCGHKIDHGVLVVGYGIDDNGDKFWKVKNSWGSSWGEDGYIRMARDIGSPSGQCGIATVPSYPTAKLVEQYNATENSIISINVDKSPNLVAFAKKMSIRSRASINQCGDTNNAKIKFTELIIDPRNPQRGSPVKFYGNGDIIESFDNVEFNLVVKLGGIPVFSHSGSMCGESSIPIPLGLGDLDIHGFNCPIVKETTFKNVGADVNLPSIAPSGDYEIELRATDDNKQVFCVHVQLGLSAELVDASGRVYEYM